MCAKSVYSSAGVVLHSAGNKEVSHTHNSLQLTRVTSVSCPWESLPILTVTACTVNVCWPEKFSRYSDSLRAERSGDRKHSGEILRNRPDWSWGPPSLLHKGYSV